MYVIVKQLAIIPRRCCRKHIFAHYILEILVVAMEIRFASFLGNNPLLLMTQVAFKKAAEYKLSPLTLHKQCPLHWSEHKLDGLTFGTVV